MKPEPLKDKGWRIGDGEPDIEEEENNEEVFYKHNVKSAVEWLKDKLEHYYCDELKASNTRIERKVIETWIDKAFEDITKK